MPKVGVADRLFLTVESDDMPQHVGCLATFRLPDGAHGAYLRRLSADLREVTSVAEPFNFRLRNVRLKGVAPAWDVLDDSEIDLDYHLRHSALPEPGGERELGVLVSRLHSRALDPTRPLWEFHIIEGLENNRFAIYFKVHQSLLDIVGCLQRMSQMVMAGHEEKVVRPVWSIGPKRVRREGAKPAPSLPLRAGKLLATVRAGVSTATEVGKAATSVIKDVRKPEDAELAAMPPAPRSVLNGRVGTQRRFATQSFEFDRIRSVARACDVTVDDVFFAICGGGLRRYLDELGALPDEGLLAGTPVALPGSQDGGAMPAFTMTVMKLFTDVADPVERLRAIGQAGELARDRMRRVPRTVADLYGALSMGRFVAQNLIGLGGRVHQPYNVIIANLPGPLDPQYLAGSRLEAMYPLTCLYHGSALFIAVHAASGRYGVGFTGDRDALPHLQRLAVYTGEALGELEQRLAQRAKTG